jgi:hypothetical protein
VVVASIIAYNLFRDYDGFYSEYEALEVRRGTRLTDKMNLRYFELPKIPKEFSAEDKLLLWLSLFAARTEEDLARIKSLEVSEMDQAIEAYRGTVVTSEFRELERLRSRARHNEASALEHARQQEQEKWERVVADRDAENEALRASVAEKDSENAALRMRLAEMEALLGKNG